MGFGFSDIFGGGSESTTAPSKVYKAQDPYLQDLYSRAQMASYGGQGQDYASRIGQGALSGYGQQMAGGYQMPGLQQGLQGLQQNLQGLGGQLQGFGGMQNEALGGAIQAGLGDISRNFQRNIMPSINTGSAMTGTTGGSRQGIAQGLAAGEANRQASDFVNQMQSQNWQQQMQNQLGAYGQMGNLYGQQGDIYGQMGGLQAQQNLAQQGALGLSPQLSNLGFGAQYGDLSALSSLIGAPAILGGGSQATTTGGLFAPVGVNIGNK